MPENREEKKGDPEIEDAADETLKARRTPFPSEGDSGEKEVTRRCWGETSF